LKASKQVRKAVIPAAGMGTRMKSLAQDQPKEMLPIGGRSMIFYAIHEAVLSGLEELCIVINKRKDSLRNYIESDAIQKSMQSEGYSVDISLPGLTFIDQPIPAGSGDAIYHARELIGDEPFALMMPDFVFFGDIPALGQLIPLHEQCGCDIVGLLSLQGKEVEGFGNVGIVGGEEVEPGVVAIHSLSGKTRDPLIVKEGARVLKAVPRWILGPHFFEYLKRAKGSQNEWDDTPALQMLCAEREVLGKILEGKGFDVGNPIGYQAAGVFAAHLDARIER
jgi:UTP--glucose-1-phosphate uridylyltransferase